MTDESPQRVGAPDGLGGPGATLPVHPDRFTPCECVESDVLWGILTGEVPAPDTAGWRATLHLIDAFVMRRLVEIRPMLVESDLDRIIPNRFLQLELLRNSYEIPAWAVSGNAMLARRRRAAA